MTIVYTAGVFDLFHIGHLNLLKKARTLGDVIVGVVTDECVKKYKKDYPVIPYEQRVEILKNIKGVIDVEPFVSNYDDNVGLGYVNAILEHRPDYVVHADFTFTGPGEGERKAILRTLKEVGHGEFIEFPYTEGISSTIIKEKICQNIQSKGK